MAQGTVIPAPKFVGLDANGNPLSGGKLTVTLAGTSTPVATYSDVGLTTPNANPVILDSSGRATIYLTPGTSYKFALTDSSNGTIWTQDNVLAVPASAATVDQTETAGEALTAGLVVYLSDGSGGKTQGQVYKADSANTYSSTTPLVGMVPAAIASGSSGAFRTNGQVTGLAGLTVGTDYYVGTAGALTATVQANNRYVGRADSTSSLILQANPPPATTSAPLTSPILKTSVVSSSALLSGICQGRLTLTTATPVTSADVTAATTLLFTPYLGNNIGLYDGSANWTILPFTELSIAVPATTSQMYDVFVFNNSGVAALELLAWTNDTTRATALVLQNGVLVKTGATTRRYVGSFRTTTVSGQTEDSATKRYVWNQYNRVRRSLARYETNTAWTYMTATWRQANGSTSNQVDVVIGQAEALLDLLVRTSVNNSGGAVVMAVGIGEDVTNAPVQSWVGAGQSAGANVYEELSARGVKYPAVGRHFYAWLEYGQASGTTTWAGHNQFVTGFDPGLTGWIEG